MSAHLVDPSSTIECPKCGKHTVVSYQTGVYHCLSCDFERDFSSETGAITEGGLGALVFGAAGFLITLIVLL